MYTQKKQNPYGGVYLFAALCLIQLLWAGVKYGQSQSVAPWVVEQAGSVSRLRENAYEHKGNWFDVEEADFAHSGRTWSAHLSIQHGSRHVGDPLTLAYDARNPAAARIGGREAILY